MTKDEALKLALPIVERERFEQNASYGQNFNANRAQKARRAYEAIKEALQSNEQVEPVGQLCEEAYGRGQVMWFNKPADGSYVYTHPPVPTAQPDDTAKLYEELRSIIDGGSESFTHEDAVQYLKDKLAQPDHIVDANKMVAQPEQEPVAWTVEGQVRDWSKDFSAYRTQHYVRPVFTAPPQRTWVGLTMNEMDDLNATSDVGTYNHIKAIEAKLKEKNT